MKNGSTSRRDWLKGVGLGAVSAAIGAQAWSTARGEVVPSAATIVPKRKPGAFRVAHLTDVHIQSERGADRGLAACLRHVQSMPDRPDFILNTGDSIYDAMKRDRSAVTGQWKLWQAVLKDENSLPMAHCLGNHDIWGWDREKSGTTGNEPGFGKQWALDELGLEKSYSAFDCGGWRFILLDSMTWAEGELGSFSAKLDEEQFAWLESQLNSTDGGMPILIATHVPIISPASLLDVGAIGGTPEAPALLGRRVHIDVKRFGHLFANHPNIKLCISGHLHQIDRAHYQGITYLCNPAVSGAWWKGDHVDRFGEMYTVLDLLPDGTFEYHYVDYGWKPEEN